MAKRNQEKLIEEAKKEWDREHVRCCRWDYYLLEAIAFVLGRKDGRGRRASPEAVGAAKVLQLAIRLQRLEANGHSYSLENQYNDIKEILEG